MTTTHELPPYFGIMAVDTVKFTRNPSAHQPRLSEAIPRLVQTAFEQCGLDRIWESRAFDQGTGDGFFFGVPYQQTAFLLYPLLDKLQKVLEEHDRLLRGQDRDLRLRLRAAIHLGAVSGSGDDHDRVGTPVNDTFRLLDSGPVRQAMDTSNPDVTLLAAIVSQHLFEVIVRAGHTPGLHPDRFEYVTAEVADKGFVQPAWMYVPKPSRASAQQPAVTAQPPATDAAAPGGTTIHGNVGNSVSGGNVSGNVRQTGGRAS
jgi:hypothetical protein